jgi:hypothetical protein
VCLINPVTAVRIKVKVSYSAASIFLLRFDTTTGFLNRTKIGKQRRFLITTYVIREYSDKTLLLAANNPPKVGRERR